jgi:AcrR family transcriptional regulator
MAAQGTSGQTAAGRVNQKRRTHLAIVRAATDLIRTGREVTMPEVARTALVSEATAYRYFPDMASLLQEAMTDMVPSPDEVLAAIGDRADPVERVGAAAEFMLRHVLTLQGAIRAMIAATVAHPQGPARRPGLRFGVIDQALAPVAGAVPAEAVARLKLGLSLVVSAEALFNLMDLAGLDPDAAVAAAADTARTLTRAALAEAESSGGA